MSLGLIALGIACAAPGAFTILKARTTLIPQGRPSRFVSEGIYAVTRNPIYLGMTLIYVGFALRAASIWPLVAIVVPWSVMNFVVIPFEERRLLATFGAQYDRYRGRVRRWV
jgi:protein-S-isoprenylcysteine O-methyltransferase Ste14